MLRRLLVVVVAVLMVSSASADVVLKVDFNSNQDGGGDSTTAGDPGLSAAAHNQTDWSSYHANHEVAAEFGTANYGGITVTPAWPNTTANTVQQSIDRAAGNDGNWDDTAGDLNLVTDFIGTDTRTANGGNGNWDGTTGTPTYMTLTLGGLTAGAYEWTSFHHDTEHVHGPFAVWLSTDGGATFTQLADGIMTDSTAGGTPDSGAVEGGPDAYSLPSTYRTSFTANGVDDVVFRFAPQSDAAGVHRQIWGMNGFVLELVSHDQAFEPTPTNGATDVAKSVVLSWSPADDTAATNGHKIFLSDNFADVSDGLAAAERGVFSDPVFDTATLPSALEYSTTYYWRVDQASTPGGPWNPGEVWSFTVEPFVYAIENIVVTASSSDSATTEPENTINASGLDANDLHSTEKTDMWLSGSESAGQAWIEYQFDKVYKLHEMWVWNFNVEFEAALGFGFNDVTIEYSTNGSDWTVLGGVPDFAQGPATPDYAHNTPVDFGGVSAKYVKITANSNWGSLTQYGLSEVRFLYTPVRARLPQPTSGATNIDVDGVTVRWRAGREAASHDLYLSTDKHTVADGTASAIVVSDSSYDAGDLDLGQTYYWKINEVNGAETPTIWEGDVWNFGTLDFLVVDDFEAYNDISPGEAGSNRIFLTWIGGDDEPANGSQVGHNTFPFAEQTIVNNGNQSMPFYYNNSAVTYSEATVSISDLAIGPDWTRYGIKTLALSFHGDPNNTGTEQMYVELNGSRVDYEGSIETLRQAMWHEWNIDLRDFEGADLGNVTELSIGFERSGAGGSGWVYFDDIRLYPARCLAELVKPGADLNDDCVVDLLDAKVMANQWLSTGLLVTPQPPSTASLVARYEFEGNADDSVGARDGVTTGGPTYVAGNVGQAIHLDGLNDYLFIDGSFQLPEYTMAVWFRSDGGTGNRDILSAYAPGVLHGILLELQGPGTLRFLHRCPLGSNAAEDNSNVYSSSGTYDDGAWHHAAIVMSGTEITLYVDGGSEGSTPATSAFESADALGLAVGILDNERTPLARLFVGAIDDVRIYERALSHAEVASLAGRTEPFSASFDLDADGSVDLKDFALLADQWLDEQLWPQP